MAQLPESQPGKGKPFLDGRCEWQRGGVRIPEMTRITECAEPSAAKDVQWCEGHRCIESKCANARVKDERCVIHQPGSLYLARQARQKEEAK